jgi:hypothetical protein
MATNVKWIDSRTEHEARKGQTLVTRNHDVIKAWAEERGAVPATVPGAERGGHLGVLIFDFPGYGGEKLGHLSWDEWFRTFEDRKLVFKYQEHKADGAESNFFQLDNPNQ